MRTLHRLTPFLVYAAVAAGCATGPQWSPVENHARSVSIGRFNAEIPADWMQVKTEVPEKILILVSRDGPNLQAIEIARIARDNAFLSLKRGVPAGALPAELAELELADMKSRPGMENTAIIKNEPIRVADINGYLLHTRFKNGRGLPHERITVGFVDTDGYYTLIYQAPTLHYFARDRREFDAVLRSLRQIGAPNPQ